MRAKLRSFLLGLLRHLLGLVGGVAMSRRAADELMLQRNRAATKLAEIVSSGLEPGLSGVVVSKDRALQLYSLLCTYRELVNHPAMLTVIYSTSTEAHSKAYKEVEKSFSDGSLKVEFVKETDSFRVTINKVLSRINTKNIFFLVDDIVFIRPVDLAYAAQLDTSRYILSFRHSPALTRSYTSNVNQSPPKFSEFSGHPELLQFRWFEAGHEWSDPWSLDGQVLSTAEVKAITEISDFVAPNTYEAALKTFSSICTERLGLCYLESKILNLPINRVQSEVKNLSGEISPEYLLGKWNNGMMLDTEMLRSHIPRSTHEEHAVILKMRSDQSKSNCSSRGSVT